MIEQDEVNRWERQLATMLRAAASDDPETFATVANLLEAAAGHGLAWAATRMTTAKAAGGEGYSWADLGRAYGMTRQGAHRRFATAPARVKTAVAARLAARLDTPAH